MSGDEKKEKISLENFSYETKNRRLTSPLSIQACKLHGVTEEDLIYVTFENYIHSHPESMNLPKEFQLERYDNFEQNRKDLIESLKEIREELKKAKEKELKKQRGESEEKDDDTISSKRKTTLSIKSKDTLKQKLKNNMEYNIKMLINKEFDKKKNKTKKDWKNSLTSKKNKIELFISKERYKSETKLSMKKNKAKNINYLLDLKQKEYIEKDESRKKHIEEMRNEINKKRNEESEMKKAKVAMTLAINEEKMREKIKNFYRLKHEKEERIEKREKERTDELNKKYQEDNKKKTDILKAAILRNEQFKNKKYEIYNKKLKDFQNNMHKKEEKDKEKKMREKQLNELKESQVNRRMIEMKNKEKEDNERYMQKQEQLEERLKLEKKNKEKENLIKSNKLFIYTSNLRLKNLRDENAKHYKLNLKLENIDKRRQLMKERKEKMIKENAEKRKLEEEIDKDRKVMMERLKKIIINKDKYTKQEVSEYVINGKKPRQYKTEESNKSKDINKKTFDLDEEDEYATDGAFITGMPEN